MTFPIWAARRRKPSILPYSIDFSTLGDGALPAVWEGSSKLVISGGQAINTGLTLGSEKLTNGSMESGSPPSSWDAVNDAALTSQADERTGGAGSASLDVARDGTNSPYARQFIADVGDNNWIRIVAWLKNIDATSIGIYESNSSMAARVITSTDWTQVARDGVMTSAGGQTRLTVTSSVDTQHGRFDDVSLKVYSSPNELAKHIDASIALVTVKATITADANSGSYGVDCCMDNPSNQQNYVRAWLNRFTDTVQAIKCVAGDKSSVLAETAVTYAAGAALEIRHTAANTFQVWYNNAQVGGDLTISDAGIIANTRHGLYGGEMGGAGGFDAFFCE